MGFATLFGNLDQISIDRYPMAKSTRTAPKTRGKRPTRRTSDRDTLYPLNVVYRRAGVEMPAIKVVAPYEIPMPYRSLLVGIELCRTSLKIYHPFLY